MDLSKVEILEQFNRWLTAWNKHDLAGVMDFIHEDILFENWDGKSITGKESLKRAWIPWFMHHGNFKFIQEEFFINEQRQAMIFQWKLKWPSIEIKFKGQPEIRRGVDIMYLKDGKIFRKITYSKTAIQIGTVTVEMHAL
ncbi:MAG TPA: nuclear transport factor 2 family protein [Chitinophagaceae bacterium]|jgi:hypothetical protein|nr:nuclear transport factor 2 family protein [Chitinophagaceae bacterium]